MVKSELIKAVAQAHPGIYKSDIEAVVETIFQEMAEALKRGEKIELRKFGSFKGVNRRPVSGKNPKTGKPMEIPPYRHVRFKLSKVLREFIQDES